MAQRLAARSRPTDKTFDALVWTRDPKTDELVRQPDLYSEGVNDDLVEFKAPARAPTIESDVSVPLRQAAITGALWAGVFTGCYWFLGLPKPLIFLVGSDLLMTSLAWSSGVSNMRRLMWRIEKFAGHDFDKDGHKGEPPQRSRSRTVIERQGSAPRLPESWEQLDAEQQVPDVWRFAEIVWSRQEAGLGTGQKALRGTALPSGFEMNDDIHSWMLADLDDAGVIRRNGSNWRLEARPEVIKKLIRVETW